MNAVSRAKYQRFLPVDLPFKNGDRGFRQRLRVTTFRAGTFVSRNFIPIVLRDAWIGKRNFGVNVYGG